jgi:gluconolactonase
MHTALLALLACGPVAETDDTDAFVPGPPAPFADVGGTTEGIALGHRPDGSSVLYVGVRDVGVVTVSPDGSVAPFATIDAPVGLAVDVAGDVLACGRHDGAAAVLRLDAATGAATVVLSAAPDGSPLGMCNFIAVAPDGSLVFTDSERDLLIRADADGANAAIVSDALDFPNGLAFSPSGDTLYVASWSTDTLWAFPLVNGAYGAATAAVTGAAGVDGVVALTDGSLVLVTSASGILRVSPGESPIELLPPGGVALPANGVMGDAAFGEHALFLTSLASNTVTRLAVDGAGVPLPVGP